MQDLSHKYGPTFGKDWPVLKTSDIKDSVLLKLCSDVMKPDDTTLDVVKASSAVFPVEFPVKTIQCANLSASNDLLTSHINSVYPLIHECVLLTIEKLLKYKQEHGSNVEKKLYKDMVLTDFIQRLLEKRAVTFVGAHDRYVLFGGKCGSEGWDKVGTDAETAPLLLKDCLSYDEQKISAFLSVASYSEFINSGSRRNCGKLPKNKNEVQNNGVIIGLIGPRLKRISAMDYQEMVITAEQNTESNGYGDDSVNPRKGQLRKIWSSFYGEPNFSHESATRIYENDGSSNNGCRFTKLNTPKNILFDNVYYKKRLSVSFDTLLIEANSRAKAAGTSAYIHLVGIGLGVWKISEHQEEVFLETFAQRLRYLLPKLHHVSDVVFAYFNIHVCGNVKSGEKMQQEGHPSGGIKIEFSLRDPHARLTGADANKLLVVSYAWDSNSLPGNEFWSGNLATSGDPAAACSTQIAELHNAFINKAKVNGRNLHVASIEHGVLHISEYARKVCA